MFPPRGEVDNPEINPITVALYTGCYYVQRCVKKDDATAYCAAGPYLV